MSIQIRIDNRVRVQLSEVPTEVLEPLKQDFTYANPEWATKRAIGVPTWGVDAHIKTWRVEGEELSFPRGGYRRVRARFERHGYATKTTDARHEGSPCARFPSYQGPALRYYQVEALRAAVAKQNCIVRAPTGSGKSLLAIALAAEIGLNTIVILPTVALFKQWCDDACSALKLKPSDLGVVHGNKRDLRPLTVAVQGTLASRGIDEEMRDFFGVVVVDECFTAGTPILMSDGTLKSIEQVCVGDETAVGGRVTALMHRPYDGDLYRVGDAVATEEHPIATGAGWVKVSDIRDHDLWCDPLHADRPGAPGAEGSGRDRREQPRPTSSCGGRAEDLLPRVEGVAGCSLPGAVQLRRGRADVHRVGRASMTVYNLETERHVYVAGGVLVHNCQKAAAKTYLEAVDPFPAKYRFGISADERRKDRKEFLTHDLFADVAYEISRRDLEHQGFIVDVEIRVVPTAFDAPWFGVVGEGDETSEREGVNFKRLIDEMTADDERNAQAIEHALHEVNAGNQVILLSHRREHCQLLDRAFVERGVRSGFFIGGADYAREFDATRKGIESGSVRVGVGTYGALGYGVNLPSVAAGVAATPIGGNKQNFNQVRGRLCRLGKSSARLYVLWDWKVYPGHLANMIAWNPTVRVLERGKWVEAEAWRKRHKDKLRRAS